MDTPFLTALTLGLLSFGRREPSGEDGSVSRPNATTGQLN